MTTAEVIEMTVVVRRRAELPRTLLEVLKQSRAVRISVTNNGESACVVDHYIWPSQDLDGGLLILQPSAIRVSELS